MTSPRPEPDLPHLPDGPSDATTLAIRAAVMADLAPRRPRSLRRRVLIVGAGALVATGMAVPTFGMSMPTPDHARAAAIAASAGLVLVLVVAASFAPAAGRRLGARARLAAAAALGAAWAAYLVAAASAFSASAALEMGSLLCGMRALVSGLVVAAAAFWAFRHADPWTPRRTGALVGAAAGCLAGSAVGIACGSAELGHLLVGHGLIVPLLAGLGALIARRALAP
jgi:hypothetical protein